jgi:hypothetical protein
MGVGSRAFLAGGLGFAAAFAVACGSSNGLLSSGQSSTLAGDLQSISSAVASGRCAQAQRAATTLNNDVAGLRSVTSPLLQNLAQGAGTVSQLAASDCHPHAASSSSSASSSSPSSTASSTSSVAVTTTTTTTTITPTQTSTSSSSTPSGGGTATSGGSSGTSTSGNGGAGVGGAGGTATGNGQ